MPMIVCLKCNKFYHPKKIGVAIEEGMPLGDGEVWGPYKLWQADLLECRSCGDEIVAGFGSQPIAERYQPDYAENVERFAPIARIEDCP